jgi:putative sugar O-methyltransferase
MTSTLFNDLFALCQSSANQSQKSSHWTKLTSQFRVKKGKIIGISGFSPRSKRLLFLTYYYHAFLQRLNFGKNFLDVYNSRWYGIMDNILARQRRSLDNDAYRHVCTLLFLERHIRFPDIHTVCVIGDGQANFVSPILAVNTFSKVISVNLPEVLLSDLELILKSGTAVSTIILCTKQEDLRHALQDQTTKLVLIPASSSQILFNQPIDLFVNIASFGEMTSDTIAKYFSIIKSSVNGAYLYCCNRLEKRLDDRESTVFDNYPWEGYESIYCDEPCPWHQQYYTTRFKRFFPFPTLRRSYDGQINHRLVRYPPLT